MLVTTELVTNEVQNSETLIKKYISHYQLVSAKNGFDVGWDWTYVDHLLNIHK